MHQGRAAGARRGPGADLILQLSDRISLTLNVEQNAQEAGARSLVKAQIQKSGTWSPGRVLSRMHDDSWRLASKPTYGSIDWGKAERFEDLEPALLKAITLTGGDPANGLVVTQSSVRGGVKVEPAVVEGIKAWTRDVLERAKGLNLAAAAFRPAEPPTGRLAAAFQASVAAAAVDQRPPSGALAPSALTNGGSGPVGG